MRTEKLERAYALCDKAFALEEEGRIAEAIKIYKEAALLGEPAAMSNLGNLLDDKMKPPRAG